MGTVTQTIGTTGRTYSTIALWAAGLPANLVTNGNSYVGQCFNDSEFLLSSGVSISGNTTDSTHFITLTTGSGQSFRDNASVQTNALRYNVLNGVGLRMNAGYVTMLTVSPAFSVISKLQVSDGTNGGTLLFLGGGSSVCDSCILQSNGSTNPVNIGTSTGHPGDFLTNCLVIDNASSDGAVLIGNDGLHVFANNTIVRASDASGFGSGIALKTFSGGHYAGLNKSVNNAAFGFSSFTDDVTNFGSSGHNASNLAGTTIPGTSNQASLTYASQFPAVTKSTMDYRAKSGGGILDNGATDTTDIPSAIDIVGTARPQGTAWDIGCWELASSSASYTITAAEGTYTFTGEAQSFLRGIKITAVEGVYTFTGETQGLGVGLPASQGSYTFTGEAQSFQRGIKILPVQGVYTFTGEPQSTNAARTVSAVKGTYTFTGGSQNLLRGRTLIAAEGTYTFTGETVTLTKTGATFYVLTAQDGTYVFLGKNQTLIGPAGGGGKTYREGYDALMKEKERLPSVSDQIRKAAAVISSLGGHARRDALSPKERSNIASIAAKARWK